MPSLRTFMEYKRDVPTASMRDYKRAKSDDARRRRAAALSPERYRRRGTG